MHEITKSKMASLGRRGFLLGGGAAAISAGLAACTLDTGAGTPSKTVAAATGGGGSGSGLTNFQPLSAKARSKKLTIALVMQQLSAQSDQHSVDAFKKYVKDENLPWDLRIQDAKGDPGTLSSMMTDSATAGVDGMVVGYGTLTSAQAALQAVAKSGVPLLTIDSGYFAPAVCDITSNNYNIGGGMADYLINRLQSKGKPAANICVIYANFHHGTLRRGRVLDAALKDNQWINVLDTKVIEYTGFYETSLNTVQDWISRHGDKLDAIWCPWDEPAEAAAEALSRAGKDVNDVFVIGADGTAGAVEKMKAKNYPQVYTAAQAFELWSPLAALVMGQIAAEGKPAREVVPVTQIATPSPELVVGANLPKAGILPWKATDFNYLMRDSAMKAAGMS
ncbi:MAG: hypothetical protein EPN48_11020 [Microbacteriaceae bacterium]|nr:MAG: hypothetical protein EPN48_11020 [Microbacteriaceae bacterium]